MRDDYGLMDTLLFMTLKVEKKKHNIQIANTSSSTSFQRTLTKITVCKVFFLSTLGMKTDSHITDFVKAKQSNPEDVQGVLNNGRGKHVPTNKKTMQPVKRIKNRTIPKLVTTDWLLHPTAATWSMI